MPSKRKKNKRRMRRVQAQRRALEEQHAANPPVKASRGIAVSAPPAGTTKKAAKAPPQAPAPAPAPAPEKISRSIPAAVPTVETPKLEPKAEPVAKPIPDEVQAPESEVVLLEQTPATAEIEIPTPVTVEARAVETPSVKPSTVEANVVQEPEPKIPETEPITEVTPSSEAPVVAASETEIHTVDSAIIKTETQETEDKCERPEEAEALAEKGAVTEVEVEVAVTEDIAVPEPVTRASEKTVGDSVSGGQVSAEAEPPLGKVVTETVAESVVEVVTDVPESERVTEAAVSPTTPAAEDGKEVLAEENAPEVPSETAIKTEHTPVDSVEAAAVPDTSPEAAAQEAKPKEDAVATLIDATAVDEFVVTESVSAVEVATESAAVQQEILPVNDTLSAQTYSVDVTTSEFEPAAAPAEHTDAAESKCLDRQSEASKSEIRDVECQMEISVESVQLSSVEMPVETALNAHIVPEVSIEG
ncbi:skin secretory protein xP2 isoform X2 [Simochromis diagramma]|uniref:skin secretory protein xP2 isoform X2 n=1 Tax=Simochromis diagramma TaxID=43689 RepID=UPI001A7ED95E|nr:skin secretory protein xP2 isoform X2 [Simochromis diagramma]